MEGVMSLSAPLQEVSERESVVEQLRKEVEEGKVDSRRSIISRSDLQTSEIMQLKKVIAKWKIHVSSIRLSYSPSLPFPSLPSRPPSLPILRRFSH